MNRCGDCCVCEVVVRVCANGVGCGRVGEGGNDSAVCPPVVVVGRILYSNQLSGSFLVELGWFTALTNLYESRVCVCVCERERERERV